MAALIDRNNGQHDEGSAQTMPPDSGGWNEPRGVSRFSMPNWLTRRAWREAPLACLNRVLLIGCGLMTVAAPLYLWRDATVVETPARVERILSHLQPRATPTLEEAQGGEEESAALSPKAESDEAEVDWIDQEFSSSPDSLASASAEEETGEDGELSSSPGPGALPEHAAGLPPPSEPAAVPRGQYAQIAGQRNFFRTVNSGDAVQAAEPLSITEASGLAQRYAVAGILLGKSPRAIIRDTNTNTSTVVSTGQSLNGYRVKEVLTDRVVLELNGQTFELKM